jgi:probable HAF family extracellular repeat protein/VCBS repeat-containing protein
MVQPLTYIRKPKNKFYLRQRCRRVLLESLESRQLLAADLITHDVGWSTTEQASVSVVGQISVPSSNSELAPTFRNVPAAFQAEGEASLTALDAYVSTPDASYSYTILASTPGPGFTRFDVQMTSQTWRSVAEVGWNQWKHRLAITIPTTVSSGKSLLIIGGGDHGGTGGAGSGFSNTELTDASNLSVATGTVVAMLSNVPYQPLQFAGDSEPIRAEDGLIAKSYREFLDGGDQNWPALLPMVKSAVRAMDTVQDLALKQRSLVVNEFVVSGASKRGWTTWLTAAVDSRVKAIAPMVINVLNMQEQMEYHRQAYEGVTQGIVGGYSFAVQDYVNQGIFDRWNDPRGQELLRIVDPYQYRSRLTMPKFMINGTGDQFFVPDSDQFFFDDLSGSKYIRYVPNVGHGLGTEAVISLEQFYRAIVSGAQLPNLNWTVEPDGSITVDSPTEPTAVLLWQASNAMNRDFRQGTPGVNWTSSPLTAVSPGRYVAQVSSPPTGASAFMVELTYDVGGQSMKFTTEVVVREAATPTFTQLGFLPGNSVQPFSAAQAISSDGSTVVGRSKTNPEAFRWTQATGMVGIGFPSGANRSVAYGISADGTVVVGESTLGAFRWTNQTGFQNLGNLPGGTLGRATSVSGDGSVVAGWSSPGGAFLWTEANGLQSLGFLQGGNVSRANAISHDGAVIVGYSTKSSGEEAFRWTQSGGMVGLGTLPGSNVSRAEGVSSDGSVIVGSSLVGNSNVAFRWTQASGMVSLGYPAGSLGSSAKAASADGTVVVGTVHYSDGDKAFYWTERTGMIILADYLLAQNVSGFSQWNLRSADGISADGLVIVGRGINPTGNTEAWLIRLSPENTASLQPSLDPIDSRIFDEDSGPHEIALTGIGLLAAGTVPLRVSATSSNPGLVSNLSAVYSSPDTQGKLLLSTASNQIGTATITVKVESGGLDSNLQTVQDNFSTTQTFQVDVIGVNDAPEFTIPDRVTVKEDQGLITFTNFATDVRPGPIDAIDEDSQSLTFRVSARFPELFLVQPSIIRIGSEWALSFEMAPNINSLNIPFSKSLLVDVKLIDSGAGSPVPNSNESDWRAFLIEAESENDPPISTSVSLGTAEDVPLGQAASSLLVNALGGPTFDELTQEVRIVAIENATARGGIVIPVFSSDNSRIESFTYLPPRDAIGTDLFLFIMQDNGVPPMRGTGTAVFTIQPLNDPPQFNVSPSPTVVEDAGPVSIESFVTNVLPGPLTAEDELPIQMVVFHVTAERPEFFTSDGLPSISPSGKLSFQTAPDVNGDVVIRVLAEDDGPTGGLNRNTSAARTLTISVAPANDPPVFTGGIAELVVDEDSGLYSQPWANNIAAAAGLLATPQRALDEITQIVRFELSADRPELFSSQPTISSSGVLSFTTSPNAFGKALVSVIAIDNGPESEPNRNRSQPMTLTINLRPINDVPVASGHSFTVDENSVLNVNGPGLLQNVQDVDLPLDRISVVPGLVESSLGAKVNLLEDGSFAYDPTEVTTIQQLSTGQLVTDLFAYRVRDEAGAVSSLSTVTFTVTGVDDAPTARPDSFVMGPGQTRDLSVLTNDQDVDSLIDSASIRIVRLPTFGSLAVLNNGLVRYSGSHGFVGTETFSYTIADLAGNRSNEAMVTIEINQPPLAFDDNVSSVKDQAIIIQVLENDLDPDPAGSLNPASVQIVSTINVGTTEILSDGTIKFVPPEGFFGTAAFRYQVADNTGNLSNEAQVTIRVARSRWQNASANLDVNADGRISAIDALAIINYLNSGQSSLLAESNLVPPPFLDVNGDERVTALDSLLVINYLNDRSGGGGAEGEAPSGQAVATSAPSVTAAPLFVTSQAGINAASSAASSDGHLTQSVVSDLGPKTLALSSDASTGQVPVGAIVATVSDSPAESEASLDQDDDVVALLSSKSKAACSHSELVDSFFADI